MPGFALENHLTLLTYTELVVHHHAAGCLIVMNERMQELLMRSTRWQGM